MSNKNDVLNNLLNELIVTVKDAKNFAVDQAPDIAKEMISEEKVVQSVSLAMGSFTLLASLGLGLFALLGPDPKNWNDFSVLALGRCSSGLFCIIGLLFSTHTVYESSIKLLRLKVAPKVFLLNKLSRLVK